MDSLFITLPKDTFLFRAKTPENMLLGNWFGLSIEEVRGYGTHIGKFKINRDLKFINISSLQFFNNFSDLLNLRLHAPTINETNNQKAQLLFPIGLFGYESQKKLLLNMIPSKVTDENTNIDVEESLPFFNNKSRVSIHSIDDNFAKTVNIFYNTLSDGFISPLNWPSKIENGFMLKELYIFNISDITLETEFDLPTIGGNLDTTDNTQPIKIILPMSIPQDKIDAAFNKIYGSKGSKGSFIKEQFSTDQTTAISTKTGGASQPVKFILPEHHYKEVSEDAFAPINISVTKDLFLGMPTKETPHWLKLIEKPVNKKKNITRKRRTS